MSHLRILHDNPSAGARTRAASPTPTLPSHTSFPSEGEGPALIHVCSWCITPEENVSIMARAAREGAEVSHGCCDQHLAMVLGDLG